MKTNYANTVVFCTILICLLPRMLFSQCLPVPPAVTCPVAGSIPLTEGAVLTTGNTYVVTGVQNINSITMNGGSLVICGTLNLANITFTSGTIQVSSGGVFNYTNGSVAVVMGANSNIYNYGTVNFSCSIVTGANNVIYNCTTSSVFSTPFNQLVVQGPNTFFINNGIFTSSYFIVQSTNSPGVICSGNGSVIVTNTMINQFNNAFSSPNGPSCIQIISQIINSQSMTNSANVNICYQSGSVSVFQGPAFGSATLNPGCSTCAIPLPVTFTSAKATCYDEKIQIEWNTQSEPTPCLYAVQASDDGAQFSDVTTLETTATSTNAIAYSTELNLNGAAKPGYLRVRRTSPDNTNAYSPVITVDCPEEAQLSIYPTMVTGDGINIICNEPISEIVLYSVDGKRVQVFPVPDKREFVITLNKDIALGQYVLTVQAKTVRTDKILRIIR